ncbi:hypothetical protein GCM10017786_39240 [Amycolatopsis deserti]|uniref:MoaB/Mog domain-containing protein n=1 Tax=Amycolatopsis deserti TaxID=185696 RepID=A0ABQ3J825_9PSEU|nr:molybdenum cofactor biosynthesis protein MoaE [Amycolatopsis deserti]GHF02175.1 hypothetical protein GCM10017786_39240 [Amycolatopsis deserti]
MSNDKRTARVIVASNRASAGVYADHTGPVIVGWLRERGFDVPEPRVVPDGDPVAQALREALRDDVQVVITTGGTGVSPTDRTPDVTAPLLDHQLPGLAEAIRSAGLPKVPTAVLSRGLAGVAGRTLVVNLPGSRGGVTDGLGVLDGVLMHAVDQLAGGDHPRPATAGTAGVAGALPGAGTADGATAAGAAGAAGAPPEAGASATAGEPEGLNAAAGAGTGAVAAQGAAGAVAPERAPVARETATQVTASQEAGALETASEETAARKTGARETPARKTGARETGARATGARETSAREPAAPGAPHIVRAEVTDRALSVEEHASLVDDQAAGAVVTFGGVVRDHDGGKGVKSLFYEGHPTAGDVLARVVAQVAGRRRGVRAIAVSHRIGALEIGDVALACAVSADHRAEAFATCAELVDEVKAQLPVWKHQHFTDGTDEWVNSP